VNLTDEEIAYMFRRAADVLEGEADITNDGGTYDPADDVPLPDGPDNADPWGADTHTRQTSQRGSQRSSGSSRTTQGRSSQGRSAPRGTAPGGQRSSRAQDRSSRANPADGVPESGEHEDSNGKFWEFGLSDAPSCSHRMPAAYVTGEKRNGGQYHAWACPIGFGSQWKDKCDLWEFTS
jgi:hypothetical protein